MRLPEILYRTQPEKRRTSAPAGQRCGIYVGRRRIRRARTQVAQYPKAYRRLHAARRIRFGAQGRRRGLPIQGSQGTLADVAARRRLSARRGAGSGQYLPVYRRADPAHARNIHRHCDDGALRCRQGRRYRGHLSRPGAARGFQRCFFLDRIVAEDVPGRCLLGVGRRADALFLHASRSKPCRPMACGGNTVRSASTLWSDFGPKDCRRRRAAAPRTKARTKCAVPCRARSATTAERACREVLIRIAAPLV